MSDQVDERWMAERAKAAWAKAERAAKLAWAKAERAKEAADAAWAVAEVKEAEADAAWTEWTKTKAAEAAKATRKE